jgi:hypothetical protein
MKDIKWLIHSELPVKDFFFSSSHHPGELLYKNGLAPWAVISSHVCYTEIELNEVFKVSFF